MPTATLSVPNVRTPPTHASRNCDSTGSGDAVSSGAAAVSSRVGYAQIRRVPLVVLWCRIGQRHFILW